MLAQRLATRNLFSATVLFYTDAGTPFYGLREPRFLNFPPESLLEGRRVLVVDDVWDTGRTARAVRERARRCGAGEVKVACLHWKPKGGLEAGVEVGGREKGDRPDYWGDETGRWIVYPWEKLAPEGVRGMEKEEEGNGGK